MGPRPTGMALALSLQRLASFHGPLGTPGAYRSMKVSLALEGLASESMKVGWYLGLEKQAHKGGPEA